MNVVQRPDLRECAGKLRAGDRRKTHPDRIVIHRNTAGENIEALHRFHIESRWKFRIFPYHYFIDRDGTVYQIHDEMTISPHAPNRGNWRSIGVALNYDGRTEELPPSIQDTVVELCKSIMSRWPNCAIMGHSDVKGCPGPLFRVHALEARVRGDTETK